MKHRSLQPAPFRKAVTALQRARGSSVETPATWVRWKLNWWSPPLIFVKADDSCIFQVGRGTIKDRGKGEPPWMPCCQGVPCT